ncbi:hypothetical protein PRIPAC_84440 [Pristionchus pacificus]|uniref:Uncharacterized protein n=1 Tax=Pristionchus pacificus TaxID=54126 RepID=A0A454XRQ1_PRIPA|nr:hypothetical protein PRIPAC_84440 [Pristionchus pacificus]|eukprot:PDM69184.1 hypothetical protein PRIPAC_47486 [Pristionchus pacificus]
MRSLLLIAILFCFTGAIEETVASNNWFLNTQGFLVDPLYTAFVIGSTVVIFVAGAVAVLAVVHAASGQPKQSDEEQGVVRQPTASETDRITDRKTKAEEEERIRKEEIAEKMRKEEKRKEVLRMYEEWKAGKGITKLAYTKVNPLPDPKYLVAEKGTVVESDVPFTIIGGDGEVVVEGRPRGATKMETKTTSTEKSSIKV